MTGSWVGVCCASIGVFELLRRRVVSRRDPSLGGHNAIGAMWTIPLEHSQGVTFIRTRCLLANFVEPPQHPGAYRSLPAAVTASTARSGVRDLFVHTRARAEQNGAPHS